MRARQMEVLSLLLRGGTWIIDFGRGESTENTRLHQRSFQPHSNELEATYVAVAKPGMKAITHTRATRALNVDTIQLYTHVHLVVAPCTLGSINEKQTNKQTSRLALSLSLSLTHTHTHTHTLLDRLRFGQYGQRFTTQSGFGNEKISQPGKTTIQNF